MIKKGTYCLATKYTDGDPQDHWAVGFYDGFWENKKRHHVATGDGVRFRHNGFRRCEVISESEGKYLCTNRDEIEFSGIDIWEHLYRLRNPNETTEEQTNRLLKKIGIIVECVSPLEISTVDGDGTATGRMAEEIICLARAKEISFKE